MSPAMLPRIEALERLREELEQTRLDLDVADAEPARRTRDELAGQIDDYLLPRVRQMDAPLLMVVGGSTGAGKSTLVNSLVGSQVSDAGILRPTTRSPVLVCNPADAPWFTGDRILPELPRSSNGAGAGELEIVPTEALPAGLALLDSPDVDSVAAENRALAAQLLAAADAWLFVTTAARYADAVPWELLRAARERGTALAVVLNRVPADGARDIGEHLAQMLASRGLGGTALLVVAESVLEKGLVPAEALAPVRRWLDGLAADERARAALIEQTLQGALASLPRRVDVVAEAASSQATAAAALRRDVESAYARALEEIEEGLAGGTLLRGEVLARWYDVVGTGDLMRAVESRVSWARDRLWSLVTGRPAADVAVKEAVETGLASLVHAAAERAAERAAAAWRDRSAGRALLEAAPRLDGASGSLAAALEREIRAWQADVFELVRREGMSRRTSARLASLGINGAGLTVMLAVFLQTGGLTGAEIAVAGGTSAVGQKVLEAIFGDQAVRALAAKARTNLLDRARRLLEGEAVRFEELLEPVAPDPAAPDRLAAAVAAATA